MIKSHLELYLDGQWKTYHTYNQTVFDERRDGQIKSAMCYIVTQEKTRFKPMRKAKLVIQDETTTKTFYYFAYFKSQKRGPNYWWHEVTLIDVAKRVQGQMIDGLRVVQDTNNSVTLYDTFKRLCDTTPLRLTTQSNLYNPTTDSTIVSLMQSIRSPEYAWSCRTLMWECLKEIGMDMGGYFPSVEFGDNGKYILTFFPTDEITQTINDLDYISIAEGVEANQVCSEIDTDIANIIATNQGTASIVFPGQNGWITPRTDDVQLTSDNCEIQIPSNIEKIIKIYINQKSIKIGDDSLFGITGDEALDVTKYFPEYKKYISLETKSNNQYEILNTNLYKNNTCYWSEDDQKITVVSTKYPSGWGVQFNRLAIFSAITSAIYTQYSPCGKEDGSYYITINGQKTDFNYMFLETDPRPLQFRVEYVPRDTSTKLRAVKQEKCDYEYVLPYNQRAEIVDAPSLGQELDKSVNQMGVNYIKTVNRYNALSDILPIGTAYVEGADTYILTVNEYEQTSHENITVTHTFSKNWSMLSEYLKQNKQYRNTNIPTDILVRNLHYQDYFVIAEDILEGETGILTAAYGIEYASRVFADRVAGTVTEVNNFQLQGGSTLVSGGVAVSCTSFGVKKSIVFSAKMQDNLTAGKSVDPDNEYYCQDVLYTDGDGEFNDSPFSNGEVYFGFGYLNSFFCSPNLLPRQVYVAGIGYNVLERLVLSEKFAVKKSSAEHINFTYQVHFVSDMPDIVIGGLLAENNPLVVDLTADLDYYLWGLTKPLSKLAVAVTGNDGSQLVHITTSNKAQYWTISRNNSSNSCYFSLALALQGKMVGNYIGWAITDATGKIYIARNSHANENQTLYFNHMHKYHEQD